MHVVCVKTNITVATFSQTVTPLSRRQIKLMHISTRSLSHIQVLIMLESVKGMRNKVNTAFVLSIITAMMIRDLASASLVLWVQLFNTGLQLNLY